MLLLSRQQAPHCHQPWGNLQGILVLRVPPCLTIWGLCTSFFVLMQYRNLQVPPAARLSFRNSAESTCTKVLSVKQKTGDGDSASASIT